LLSFESWLNESINITDGKLVFDYGSKKGGLSTKLGKVTKDDKFTPKKSSSKKTGGYDVFSVYSIGKKTATILKTLKKKTSIDMDREDYDRFLKRTAIFIAGKIIKDVDVIVFPKSSSFLVQDLVEMISKIEPKIKIISDGFLKNDVDKIKINYHEYKVSDKTRRAMENIIKKSKKQGYLEVKTVPKMFLNYISKVLIPNNSNIKLEYVDGKKVAVLDDVISSGFSFREMANSLKTFSPKEIIGISLWLS